MLCEQDLTQLLSPESFVLVQRASFANVPCSVAECLSSIWRS